MGDTDLFDDLDGETEEGDAGSDTGEAGDDAPPPADDADSKQSKRINDLMSQAQKAEARANKLEARLKAALKKGSETAGDDQGTAPSAEAQEWMEAQREFARERAFGSDPRLAAYGLTSDSIAGDTPTAMKASVKQHIELIDAIETKVRNQVLSEYGLTPEVPGGGRQEPVDFGSMSDEDFEKTVRRIKGQL